MYKQLGISVIKFAIRQVAEKIKDTLFNWWGCLMITKEIVEQLNLPIEDYYICYFDILGYKAFFENDQNEHKKYLAEILFAIGDVESEIRKKKPKLKVEIRTFSTYKSLYNAALKISVPL